MEHKAAEVPQVFSVRLPADSQPSQTDRLSGDGSLASSRGSSKAYHLQITNHAERVELFQHVQAVILTPGEAGAAPMMRAAMANRHTSRNLMPQLRTHLTPARRTSRLNCPSVPGIAR